MALIGKITIPPDKSITHRSLIFSALTKSKVKIKNLSLGADCISTLNIFKKLGVEYNFISDRELISDSSSGFCASSSFLDCTNSGTSARLLAGLFSGLSFKVTLIGDESLSKRPMKRIIEPLSLMGANIKSNDNKLPLEITGSNLQGINYFSPIPSAQVKSSIILAGLNAQGKTRVFENVLSRNHSELMLKYLEAKITTGMDEKGYFVEVEKSELEPKPIEIVGDISSAAFFMVAAAIIPNSEILIKNVGINPTRSGILDIFKQAKIDFELKNKRIVTYEKVADILVRYTPEIQPFKVDGDIIPRLIDEIPILAVLATQAEGISTCRNAKDLRNKESDRLKEIVNSFKLLGIYIKEFDDGFEIEGKVKLNKEATLETHLDHRLAMSYYVLSLINKQPINIKGFDCTNTSFPEFLELMDKLKNEI